MEHRLLRSSYVAFLLRIAGKRACFARPEFRRDRVSYDVIPPRAARGLLDGVYSSPSIRWIIESICVLAPIRLSPVTLPQHMDGRRAIILLDVDYLVGARFDLTSKAAAGEHQSAHFALFSRRLKDGGHVAGRYLGRPDFPADMELIDSSRMGELPASSLLGSVDCGWLPADSPHEPGTSQHATSVTRYFRAIAHDGTITIPPYDGDLVYA